MAAPAATARGTPTGKFLKEGFSCKVTFGRNSALPLWERTVTPPGEDNGDAIDITTQFNVTKVTKAPQELNETTDGAVTCAYDPAMVDLYDDYVGVPDTITYRFPDGTTRAEYGYMKSFVPQEMQRGQMPEAQVVIVHTNWDEANDVEATGVSVEVAGT